MAMKINTICSAKGLVSLVAAMALATSCTSWLKEESFSQYAMRDFYQNMDELNAGLLGVYAELRSIYMSDSRTIGSVGTDEVYVSMQTNNQALADRYEHSSSYNAVTLCYRNHYRVIQRANIVINRAPGVSGISEADKNRVIGEARAIRAFCYFRLVQFFGRIPLVLKETTDADFNFNARRDPIEAIYQAIFDDLSFASQQGVLPTSSHASQINMWTAKGLLAKAFLTLGTSILRRPQPIDEYRTLSWDPEILFANCRSLCDEIIAGGAYSLVPNYGDIFLIRKKNGAESLWELQFSSESNMGSNWSKLFGVVNEGNNSATQTNCMVGQTTYRPVPGFYRYFKLGDTRRLWSIADYRITFEGGTNLPVSLNYIKNQVIDSATGEHANLDSDDPDSLQRSLLSPAAMYMGVSKYRWGTGEDPSVYWQEDMDFAMNNCPNNLILLRYADVLLMRIEADMLCNHGVASAESLEIMNNQLLARARGWNSAEGRFYTESEMLESTMAPYEAIVEQARLAVEQDPSNPELQAHLAWAEKDRDAKRARCLVDYTAATLTYDELMKQRACELCFEFHRWFDLSRTGQLHTLVPGRLVNTTNVPPVNFDFSRHYLFPIPIRELDLAMDKEAFYQNPGY